MLMTYKDTARTLGIAETTLRRWVSERRIPHLKLGRAVRFDPQELDRWIRSRAVAEGGQDGEGYS